MQSMKTKSKVVNKQQKKKKIADSSLDTLDYSLADEETDTRNILDSLSSYQEYSSNQRYNRNEWSLDAY